MDIKRYKKTEINDDYEKTLYNGLTISEIRNITVITKTNKDKTKKYYSYQLAMPTNYIVPLINPETITDAHAFYFVPIGKQLYEIQISDKDIVNAFKIYKLPIKDEKKGGLKEKMQKVLQITLPKRNIEYLRAYDEYIKEIEKINTTTEKEKDKYVLQPLKAKISLAILPNTEYDLKYNVTFNISVNFDKQFKKYMETTYPESPNWYKTLYTLSSFEKLLKLAKDKEE